MRTWAVSTLYDEAGEEVEKADLHVEADNIIFEGPWVQFFSVVEGRSVLVASFPHTVVFMVRELVGEGQDAPVA